MINKINISGFKCFEDEEFDLNKITLLTGGNGVGKSSLIQAILLSRLAIEKKLNVNIHSKEPLKNVNFKGLIPLNNGYELNLGTYFDIFRDNRENNKNEILIKLDNDIFKFDIPEIHENETSVNVFYQFNFEKKTTPFWLKNEFYYLNTERLGPRHSLAFDHTDFIHCGFKGEFTAQVLEIYGANSRFKSAMINETDDRLLITTNHWLDTIFPGVTVKTKKLGPMNAQILISSSNNKSEMSATNIGFGISYSLPIIVSGLIAKKDSILIIENPEAHLHPKGQSNIGYFLGKVAESGVKILVETHSEHFVNGMRRALLSSKNLKTKDASIYFLDGFENGKIKKILIEVENTGDLSKFPKDFFDQVNQDYSEMFKFKINKNG